MNAAAEINSGTELSEILNGLTAEKKSLPCKLFYDERGSQLFEEITQLDEYYPTRTEIKIMKNNIKEISEMLEGTKILIEPGSGSSIKTRLLLENLKGLEKYIAVDISQEHLNKTIKALRREFPNIEITGVAGDYTKGFDFAEVKSSGGRRVIYFPGSTIGNFPPGEAEDFLSKAAEVCGADGGLLAGIDLKKGNQQLENAYNDSKGITAEFNLNILTRINREFGANFDIEKFKHFAFFNTVKGRIEMHLISKQEQSVEIGGRTIYFMKGENILTEYSYKYTRDDLREIVRKSFDMIKLWTDEEQLFGVFYLKVK